MDSTKTTATTPSRLDRRDLIKLAGAGGATLAAAPLFTSQRKGSEHVSGLGQDLPEERQGRSSEGHLQESLRWYRRPDCFSWALRATGSSLGAALAGFGYSLVYPGFGAGAVRNSSPESRGLIMGIYTVFLDIAMAAGSPVLGWVADLKGLNAVLVVSACVTLSASPVAFRLLRQAPAEH